MNSEHTPAPQIKLQGFTPVGACDVDSGSIWIGDPCYIIKDKDEGRPKDFGSSWHDICKRYFERSGYNAIESYSRRYSHALEEAARETPELESLWEEIIAFEGPREAKMALFKKYNSVLRAKQEEMRPTFVFDEPEPKYTGVAQFNHDGGHAGMGIMSDTAYGDGTYTVYATYNEEGRVRGLVIDFDDLMANGEERDA